MKFQKGLLDDLKKPADSAASNQVRPQKAAADAVPFPDDDRLFQTHQRVSRSWGEYVKLLIIVSVFVVIAGAVAFYLTLPNVGDQVRPPRGLEEAVRSHFLDVEKRNAGDILFYYCETFYWARVEVEKRPDIKTNPVYQIGTYAARAARTDAGWQITAAPITAAEIDRPCG